MKNVGKIAALIATAAALATTLQAAPYSLTGTSYSQDANAFDGTAGTVPLGWSYSFSGTQTYKGTNTGTSNQGGAWAYGTTGDYSFGALRTSGTGNITLAVNFTNDTGAMLTDLVIAFNYEQWRYVNTSGWDLSGTGALAGIAAVNGADFTGSAAGVNGTPTQTPILITLTGLAIAPGASFGLSWLTTDDTGSDNGIAIDDFRLTATSAPSAVPDRNPPAICLLLGAGLLLGAERVLRRKLATI